MEVLWQSENDKHASKVLDHYWPDMNEGDIHDITIDSENWTRSVPNVDVLCGGFPCQDYSIAGSRSGLAGDRGALWWEFHRLIDEGNPEWIIGENVPGLLSSNGGKDFATIIDSLTELGYGVVWGVLDAQYFGLAQRRNRIFVVAHSGGIPRPEVLALSEGLFGYPKPRRETWQDATGRTSISSNGKSITGSLMGSFGPKNYSNHQEVISGSLVIGYQIQAELIGRSPDAGPNGRGITSLTDDPAYTLNVAGGVQGVVAFTQNQRAEVRDLKDVAGALAADPGMKQQTYVMRQREGKPGGGKGPLLSIDRSLTLAANTNDQTLFTDSTVRRLTPLECERLQGFPDGWTDIAGMPDSQRYKQLGNAVAVPVVEWIFNNIATAS